MEEPKHPSIEDLSFEDLTFGESADLALNEQDSSVKRELLLRKSQGIGATLTTSAHTSATAAATNILGVAGKTKDKRTKSDKSDRHAVLISTKGDKINLAVLLKQLEECGPVRAHHFRERQNFGFVQFLDSESADNAIEMLSNKEIDGQIIQIERIKRITPGKDPRVATVGSPQCSSLPTQLPSMIENKPDSTLVLKNLPFNLRQVQLQEILENINPSAPQSVNFHYDSIGVFRGMAFVKYRLLEDAIKVFDALNGADVHGRRVRLEYKRKVSKSSEIPSEVLEDEKLRKVWDQLREFKEDPNATEITFSTFTGVQRMYIHNMAEKLKLSHTSVGEEPNRSIIVTNKKPIIGTPGKDDMMSQFLSSSPASIGGHLAPLSTTPTNSYTSLSSTPTSSMFISKPMELSSSFGNHFLRSTPPSSITGKTPSLLINDAKIATSWEKSPTNSLLSNPFTTRGFGTMVRDRSGSDIELSTSPGSSLWRNPANSLNSFSNFSASNSFPSANAGSLSSLLQQQQQHFNISNSININSNSPLHNNINNNNNHNHNNSLNSNSNSNSLVSSPILRQPKGPDGTKGFSEGYKAGRKLVPSPLISPVIHSPSN
ncbi:hypothetical protein PPL_04560 [Heterostelium album PN500]|uniref:Uncharacterized protein n=1 Tax=Heterostelium pallidum (strain ATCC 26659 / Pp 5 / PN500) TaxID=670386 RepID=D3B7X2_HETP5|nr:hypothetical protein PPL_04560 [Heterostelium album PN500]EFA82140.1 hypothetical protein PPL_04560 [Heterostelium album PN500]|eukprot:XP_020434257.1 hypothetical protein PPL_04560 [Heterostelium album PN500]